MDMRILSSSHSRCKHNKIHLWFCGKKSNYSRRCGELGQKREMSITKIEKEAEKCRGETKK
jgi:hypothetical protein